MTSVGSSILREHPHGADPLPQSHASTWAWPPSVWTYWVNGPYHISNSAS